MASISSLSDDCEGLLLDASVVVNLNATGYSKKVLSALPIKVGVAKPVVRELKKGAASGHSDATDLDELLSKGFVREVGLGKTAQSEFISLTSGGAVSSLGDGEAATIACAHNTGNWAAIDERKARRICRERFTAFNVVSTVDVLAHDAVVQAMTYEEMRKAVFAALEVANMHVHPQHLDWVLSWLDESHLDRCLSLPRSVREGNARPAKSIG